MPGDDEALRQELLLARSVSHPNVCRVHDLAPSPWGPILVMEHIAGQTLHTHIRRRKAQGGYTADEFRKISSEAAAGLAAIHAQGLVHGDLKPGNVMVTNERAIILDFGFAQERARLSARRPGAPPDGGTPNYMAPERCASGGASPDDDMYALGLTLWEMWTCRVPEPGYRPRSKGMRSQIVFDVPSSLSVDEIKQISSLLERGPGERPQARHLRFFNPSSLTTSQVQIPHERIAPGAPPGPRRRGDVRSGSAGAARHVLHATRRNSPGIMFALDKPVMTIGRRQGQDIVMPEPTGSGAHAGRALAGRRAGRSRTSAAPTAPTRTTATSARAASRCSHGGEVQLGESPRQARELQRQLAAAPASAKLTSLGVTASPGSSRGTSSCARWKTSELSRNGRAGRSRWRATRFAARTAT